MQSPGPILGRRGRNTNVMVMVMVPKAELVMLPFGVVKCGCGIVPFSRPETMVAPQLPGAPFTVTWDFLTGETTVAYVYFDIYSDGTNVFSQDFLPSPSTATLEPSTVLLMALGVGTLGLMRRRRAQKLSPTPPQIWPPKCEFPFRSAGFRG